MNTVTKNNRFLIIVVLLSTLALGQLVYADGPEGTATGIPQWVRDQQQYETTHVFEPMANVVQLARITDANRKITGSVYFTAPESWGVDLQIWMLIIVDEVDPETNAASGWCNWQIYHEEWGWRQIQARVLSVKFGEYEDDPAAIFIVQIIDKSGWGDGVTGEYGYFWVHDGGASGENSDQWGQWYYSMDPMREFWPEELPPDLEYGIPNLPIDIERGDLAIHP